MVLNTPQPDANIEIGRLSRRDLQWIVDHWSMVDPEGGINTFPIQDNRNLEETEWFGTYIGLKQLGMSGALRKLSKEAIRDLTLDALSRSGD